MILGPNVFYRCPSCYNILINRSLMSGNTCGAMFFSDGSRIAPMLPEIPILTKCVKCNTILWLDELDEIDEERSNVLVMSEWNNIEYVDFLMLDDLWRALESIHSDKKDNQSLEDEQREFFIRQRIWWEYNRNKFENTDEIDAWLSNCRALLSILNLKDNNQLCMAAELHRNLCDFSKCLELVQKLPERYKYFIESMIDECRKHNPLTINITKNKRSTKTNHIEEEEQRLSHQEKKLREEILERLTSVIEQDGSIAQATFEFYKVIAEKCNPYAQYLLGRLYLDDRLYNLAEAIRWLEYAAFQGCKKAIFELEDCYNEDDTRYDAWL